MKGALVKSSKACPDHGRIAAERNAVPLGCGDLILVLLTLGAWLPVRWVFGQLTNPWRCPQCGRRV